MAEPKHAFIDIDGCRLSVNRAGAGETMLFLHGAGGAGRWAPFMADLADRYDVIVPEHPGFGRSDTPDWLDNVGDLAYFYLDFIERQKLGKIHLVGTSLGGWIAAELAARNTARLASLTLVGAVGITAEGEPIDDTFRMPVEENLRRYYADPDRARRRTADMTAIDMSAAAKNSATVTRLAYRPRFHNPGLAKWLHRIDVPTLLIYGDKDGLVPPKFGAAYRALIPGSRLVVLEDAGHAPFDEQRDAFLRAFREFIATLPPMPPARTAVAAGR